MKISNAFYFMVLCSCAQFPGLVFADALPLKQDENASKLVDLIQDYQNQTAVMTSVPNGPNDGYGLLLLYPDDFAQRTGLLAPGVLENEHFQIVEDEGSDTLLAPDFDGDNVLFHLTRARDYYEKLSQGSGFVNPALDHKIVVRVRVDHAYNLVTHFSAKEDYNNSRYIPSNYAGKWGNEIWFDKSHARLEQMDWYDMSVFAGHSLVIQDWFSLAIMTPLQLYEHYNAGLDAAKIPGVIYHEAFHYATDTDGLFPMASEGNPVAEDYANYFGSSINNKPMIAEIDEFSSRYYKHDYNEIHEITDTTPLTYNATSFGPAVFWQIRKMLGQERADQLIWNSLRPLNGSFKHTDVPKSVSEAAHEDGDLSSEEVAAIDALLDQYKESYKNLEEKFNPLVIQSDPPTDSSTGSSSPIEKPAPSETQKLLSSVGDFFESVGTSIAEGIGYAGTAVYAVSSVPLSFATDLVTSVVTGHAFISDARNDVGTAALGAAGGVGAMYVTYNAMSASLLSVVSPATAGATVVTFANDYFCSKSNPAGKTGLDHYCANTTRLSNVVTKESAGVGASLGKTIHSWIAGLF